MKIAVPGAGHIGATVARLLSGAGHEIAISNSQGPDSLAKLALELGAVAQALTPSAAVAWAELIVLAVPWIRRTDLPAAEFFANKIVNDSYELFHRRSSPAVPQGEGRKGFQYTLPGATGNPRHDPRESSDRSPALRVGSGREVRSCKTDTAMRLCTARRR